MASYRMMKLNPIKNYATYQNDVIFKNPSAVSQVLLKPRKEPLVAIKHSSTVTNTTLAKPLKKVVYLEETEDDTPAMLCSLSQIWRQLQGYDDWKGLVEPLHPLLRQEVIRYGEFLEACYNAFDLDPKSSRYLNCKYGKKSMLKEVGMEKCGYEVSKYIYATPDMSGILVQGSSDSTCGRWIGYVSVSSDEESKRLGRRDILVTFRGTVTNPEWISNLMSSLTPARLDPHNPRPDVMVESGILSLYTSDECPSKYGMHSCREQLLSEISRLVTKYKSEELSITIAGHSMGSSLGLLFAYDVAELGLNRRPEKGQLINITVLSFAGPRVGNLGFKTRLEELGVKVLRIVNVNDPITKLPGILFNENFSLFKSDHFESYAHVGIELALEFFNLENPCCVHDLGNYIKLLRCPKRNFRDGATCEDVHGYGIVEDVMNKARKVVTCTSSFDMSPWMAVAANFMLLHSTIGI